MIASASAGVGTPPAGGAHLGHAADADEGIHRAKRTGAAEHLIDQLTADDERRAG